MSKDLKIAICFGLIMGAILSLCNLCFAVETETVSTSSVSGIYLISTEVTFQENPSASVGYFPIEPGYIYYVTNNSSSSDRALGVSDSVPVAGGSYIFLTNVKPNSTYSFQASQLGYAYFDYSWYPNVTVTREPIEGMNGFVDAFAYSLSVNGVWDTVLACVPLIAICVLFGFGVFNIVRFIRLIIKTRGGM